MTVAEVSVCVREALFVSEVDISMRVAVFILEVGTCVRVAVSLLEMTSFVRLVEYMIAKENSYTMKKQLDSEVEGLCIENIVVKK